MDGIRVIDAAGPGAMTSAGAIIHETVEQFEKAKDGFKPGEGSASSYAKGHTKAIKTENKVNGNTRNETNDTEFTEKDGSKTSMIFSNQEKQGGIYVDKIHHPKP